MCIISFVTLDNDVLLYPLFQIDTMKCFYCPQKDVSLVSADLFRRFVGFFLPMVGGGVEI